MTTLGIGLVLVIGLGTWFHALDTNPNITVPILVMPTNNAYNYYKAAAYAMVDTGKIDWAIQNRRKAIYENLRGGRVSATTDDRPYSLKEKKVLVAENAAALQLLHTGYRYPFQHPALRSFSATFPEYQKERALARLLALQAQTDAQKGDWKGALNADLDAVQLGETMPRGGALIGMLVGEACQSIGRRGAWETVGHLNAPQARAEARRLEAIRTYHVPAADVLQEEEWSAQASLLELMQRKDWPGSLLGMTGNAGDGGNGADSGLTAANFDRWALGTRIRLTGKRTIMENYTHYMDQNIAIARQPYAAHRMPPAVPSDPVDQILLPVFAGVRFDEVEAHTQNALLLITLALQAYREDHAAFPATLRVLTPQYLRAVPDDPFALSGPMHYKRLGSRYLLYSVGPDGKDDGGKAIFDAALPAPTSPSDIDRRRIVEQDSLGDIVAGVNIP